MFAWLRNLWPFPWPWKPDDVPEPTNPILLVPGICGTQLAVRKKGSSSDDDSEGTRVWVRVERADADYKQLWGRVAPGGRHLDLLDRDSEVCVPKKDADGGLFPVDLLDPSLYVPLHVVYYFHNLIWYLKKHKYAAGKTLFGFGYDFRQSNMSHLDALEARLEEASKAAGGAKVDVITHSMGGLVMRSFLAARPAAYARLVRKWIAIASPFGGAPGFGMDALLTGVQFCQGWEQYFFVNRATMHTMCSQAPAVFELLPDPANAAVWPRGRAPPVASVVMRDDDHDGAEGGTRTVTYPLADFRKLLEASLVGYKVQTYDKQDVTLEMSPECWEISDGTRAAWRGARVPQGSQFFNVFGTGFSTAYDVEYGSVEAPVGDVTEVARGATARNFTHVEGDCTVPVCCATADGLEAVERRGFFATHRGLLELPQVWEAVLDYIEVPMEGAAPVSHPVDTRALRKRHSEALRGQAHARTKAHREHWAKSAAAMREGAKTVAKGARKSIGGDWVVVGGAAAEGHTVANPLHGR